MTDLYTRKVIARIKHTDGSYGAATWVLAGDGPDACEKIANAPHAPLKTVISAPRDGGRHRYLMKLFSVAHKALPESWPAMSYDTFRHALMIDAGCCDVAVVPVRGHRKEMFVPWSLEYAAMDDTRHKEVVDAVIKCLCQRWIPGLNSEAFTNEVLQAVG